jgi:hypothetical protein
MKILSTNQEKEIVKNLENAKRIRIDSDEHLRDNKELDNLLVNVAGNVVDFYSLSKEDQSELLAYQKQRNEYSEELQGYLRPCIKIFTSAVYKYITGEDIE